MKQLLSFSLLLLALMLPTIAHAQDFEVDGIYYNINGNQVTVSVTYQKNSDGSSAYSYSGDITIPDTVTYQGVTYPVVSIVDVIKFFILVFRYFWLLIALAKISIAMKENKHFTNNTHKSAP